MLKWVRPSSVKFPITWASFKGKQTPDGQQREYIIQDITDDYKDEIIQHTFDYFVKDEPMCKYSGKYNKKYMYLCKLEPLKVQHGFMILVFN